jgi:hypothetical protein
MFNICFKFDEPVIDPDEYTMGYMNVECDGDILNSDVLSGRGLMMVFFSLTSLLESIYKLNELEKGEYKFVGEDSSFILNIKKKGEELRIFQDSKLFCKVSFNEFAHGVWSSSELLLSEYGDQFDNGNIAKKDWLNTKGKVSLIVDQLS